MEKRKTERRPEDTKLSLQQSNCEQLPSEDSGPNVMATFD